MAIIETITNPYHFWEWLKESDSYSENFSQQGTLAVQDWYEKYSDDIDQPVEFDPIAWCCEFAEYDSLQQAWEELGDFMDTHIGELDHDATIEYFNDRTTVIELDNKHLIIREF